MSAFVRKGRRGGRVWGMSDRSIKLPPLTPFRLAVLAAMGVSQIAGANQIVTDGRTKTSIEVTGSVTDIRTQTIRGQNGFNSFHDFRVDQGNTVNLHLPHGTQNLINLVHDSRAVINGTLNGVLDGHIGGHVVFADPHGIVVGASGVLNVGSLLLTTPTSEYMDRIISPTGAIDDAAVDKLLAGEAPVSDEGVILVNGTVNVAHAVELNGQDVTVSGTLAAGSPAARKALFEATVNTDGLVEGTGVEVRHGKITIVAAHDATLNGSVSVAGTEAGDAGGVITATAGRDVTVAAGARLDASGARAGGDGGHIRIWADRNTQVAAGAHFDAAAGATGDGGFVEVSAAHNVNLHGLSTDLSAGRGGKAGTVLIDPATITVAADSINYYTNGANLDMEAGARITLEAGAVINSRHIDAAVFANDPTAANSADQLSTGDSGTITLTAPVIEIGEGAKLLSFVTEGYAAGDITLKADHSIELGSAALVDARSVSCGSGCDGAPGAITFTASDIKIHENAQLLSASGSEIVKGGAITLSATNQAHSGTSYTDQSADITIEKNALIDAGSGDITLKATAESVQIMGYAGADAAVSVAGTIRGGDVTITATSEAKSSYTATAELLDDVSEGSIGQWVTPTWLPEALLLQNLAFVAANADAAVDISDGANIDASDSLKMDASATRTAEWFTVSTNLVPGFLPDSVTAAVVLGDTKVHVNRGATIQADNELTLRATSNNTLGACALSISGIGGGSTSQAAAAIAFGYADVTTRADVDKGAMVDVLGDVEIGAFTSSSFGTIAGAMANGDQARAGLALGLAVTKTETGATLGADLLNVDNVVVAANDDTTYDRTSAGAGAGKDRDVRYAVNVARPVENIVRGVLGKVKSGTAAAAGADIPFAIGGTLAVAVTDHEAEAAILAGTTVHASGNVAVLSDVYHEAVRNYAAAGTIANGWDGSGTEVGVAAGVNFAHHEHSSQAWIGEGAVVSGAHVGVAADTRMPLSVDWEEFFPNLVASFKDEGANGIWSALGALSYASLNLGIYNTILTGGANTGGDADDAHVSGSINVFLTDSDTGAWIADGASVTINRLTSYSRWDAEAGDPDSALALEHRFASTLAVEATGDTESVLVTGQWGVPPLGSEFGIGSKPDGGAVGASVSVVDHASTTVAGVGAGVRLTAPDVGVRASNRELLINLSPSSGAGGSTGANGMVVLSIVDNSTLATLSNAAAVDAAILTVDANEDMDIWSATGAVSLAKGSAAGAGLAFNYVQTDTRALIGESEHDVYPEVDTTAPGQCGTDATGDCVIDVGKLDIEAQTGGVVATVGVAGAVVNGRGGIDGLKSSLKEIPGKVIGDKLGGKTLAGNIAGGWKLITVALGNTKAFKVGGKSTSAVKSGVKFLFKDNHQLAGQASGGQGGQQAAQSQPKYGIAASGSVGVNVTKMDTAATIDGASIRMDWSKVEARRHTDVIAAAGAAAFKGGKGSGHSDSVAGTLGLNVLLNDTSAGIADSTLATTPGGAGDVTVRALSGGVNSAVGLGMALSAGAKNAGTVAGSVSVTVGLDTTDAYIDGADISGSPGSGDQVEVVAYDHDNIASGGGELYAGGMAGVGGALTFTLLKNQTKAHIDGTRVTGFDTVDVRAASPARIISGAAVAGFTDESKVNLAGAFVINNIANTTAATIGENDGGTDSLIEAEGDVTVQAGGSDDDVLDDALGMGGFVSAFDFAGTALPDVSASLGNEDLAEDKFGGLGPLPELKTPTTGEDAGAAIIGEAGLFQGSNAKASLGVSAVYNGIYNNYAAEIDDATIRTDGEVKVNADNGARIIGLSAGIGLTDGYFAGVGSYAINVIASSTRATLGDADATGTSAIVEGLTGDSIGGLEVRAGDSREIWSAAGNLASAAGLGASSGALAVNVATGDNEATVNHGSIDANQVQVIADSRGGFASLGVAGAISKRVAFAGSLGLTVDEGSTTASIDDSSVRVFGGGPLDVAATDASVLWNGAGGVDIAPGGGAFGVAVSVNVAAHEVAARVADSRLFAPTSSVNVKAAREGYIASAAVGGAGSEYVAGGISAAANVIAGSVTASMANVDGKSPDDPFAPATAGSLKIAASDDADIWSLGGAIALAVNGVGVGGAVTANWSNAIVDAELTDSNLAISGVTDIRADTSGFIASLAAGMGVGKYVGVGGSLTFNGINNTVDAGITDVRQSDTGNETIVHAADSSAIWSGSLGAAGAKYVAVGAALAGNGIGTRVHAYMHGPGDDTFQFGTYDANDVTVEAESTGSVHSIAIGASVSGALAVAGSVMANALTGSTTAEISEGAHVRAVGDVGVLATGSRQIYGFAGAGAFSLGFGAAGMSVAVNDLEGTVSAYIAGPTTYVTALGLDRDDPLSVYTGDMEGDAGISEALSEESDADFTDQQEAVAGALTDFSFSGGLESHDVHGLAVNALSLQKVETVGIATAVSLDPTSIIKMALAAVGFLETGGATVAAYFTSGSGAALNVGVDVTKGTTEAYIDQALINQHDVIGDFHGPASDQQVDVRAASYNVTGGLAAGLSGGSVAAAAGAVSVNVNDRTTKAYIHEDSLFKAAGDVAVVARSRETSGSLALGIGGAALGAGLGATSVVNVSYSTTRAEVDSDDEIMAGNLTILAEHDATQAATAATVSIGLIAGLGITEVSNASYATTEAILGSVTDGDEITVNVPGDVNVTARSGVHLLDLGVGASVGAVGASGTVAVNVLADRTAAAVRNANIEPSGSVTIEGRANDSILSYLGAGSVGLLGGFGQAVNVNLLHSSTAALLYDSDVDTGDLKVIAGSDRKVDSVSAGLGIAPGVPAPIPTSVAMAGAVGVTVVGGDADDVSGDNILGDAWASTEDQRDRTDELANTTATGTDVPSPSSVPEADTVAASIIGGEITVSGETSVDATNTTEITNLAGAAAGGQLGAGGTVAYTQLDTEVAAKVAADTLNTRDLTVYAETDGDQGARAFAGTAGLFAGLGAATAVTRTDSSVTVSLYNEVTATDDVSLRAEDSTGLAAHALGAEVGAAVAGVVVGIAERDTSVHAVDYSQDLHGDDLKIVAKSNGSTHAQTISAALGLAGAMQGQGAQAKDSADVTAEIADGASVALAGTLAVQATATPDVSAEAYGADVAVGVGIGATVATVTTNDDVLARIGRGAFVKAGDIQVLARTLVPEDGISAHATAGAGTGGVLAGVDVTEADATDRSNVDARIEDGDWIFSSGSTIAVDAQRDVALLAESTGVAVGGLAAGASVATVDSDGEATAYFGGKTGWRGSRFELHADSTTDLAADAISGSGGLVAGAAADAEVDSDDRATAELGAGSFVSADEVDIQAHHETYFQPSANSIQAALVGFSGALANADIDSTVATIVGNGATVKGYDVALVSRSDVSEGTLMADAPVRGYSAKGGNGGVVNGSASLSDIDVDKHSSVRIGDDAHLLASDRPDATAHTGLATLTLLATGSASVEDRAYLGAGGAMEFPAAESRVNVTGDTTVTVGMGSDLLSADLLGLSAYEETVDAGTNAIAKTWGAVGVARSIADTTVAYAQNVNVGANSLLEGLGYVFLTAGRRADTHSTMAETAFNVTAYSDTYNYTLASIPAKYDGIANLTANAGVSVGSGANVIAGWDVRLGAVEGSRRAVGTGTLHIPYLEIASTEKTNHDSSISGETTVAVDGDVVAGYFNDWFFVSGNDGEVSAYLNGHPLNGEWLGQDVDAYVDPLKTFDPHKYAEDMHDAAEAMGESYEWIASSVSGAGLPNTVDVVKIHDVTATQGDIIVYGDSLDGTGTLEARGGATISIANMGKNWVEVANLHVIDHVGGRVRFENGINNDTGGVEVVQKDAGASPFIEVVNSGGTAGAAAQQPGLVVSGPIVNPLGEVSLENAHGNIYQSAAIHADMIRVKAPNGTYLIVVPDGDQPAGGDAWHDWDAFDGANMLSAHDLIAYALEDRYSDGGYTEYQFNYRLYEGGLEGIAPGIVDHDGEVSIVPYNSGSLSGNTESLESIVDHGVRHRPVDADGDGKMDYYVVFNDDYRRGIFDYVPFLDTAKESNADPETSSAPGLHANKILILADVFNVNAPVVAGSEQKVSVLLGADVKARVDDWRASGAGDRLGLTWYHDAHSLVGELWHLLPQDGTIPSDADRVVSGYFDRATDSIIMDPVQGSTGGLILIDAQILSTNKNGSLEVRNGHADIDVDNRTGYDLVVNDMSTGPQYGVIGITDRLKHQRVWYVNDVSGTTRKYVTTNLALVNSWRDAGVTELDDGLDVYQPLEGTRYWWQRQYNAVRHINSEDFFTGTATPWEFADGNWKTGTTGAFDGDITASGICIASTCNYKGDANYDWSVTDANWRFNLYEDWWSVHDYHLTYDESKAGWESDHRIFVWPTRAEVETRTSVRADYPIAIAFTGSKNGTIEIRSTGDVTVAGHLSSPGGDVNILATGTDDGIYGTADSLISAVNVDLNAGWHVGSQSDPIRVSLGGGVVNARSTQGDVHIVSPARDLRIGTIRGARAVSLTSAGSILGTGPYREYDDSVYHVWGRNIRLIATGGSIGTDQSDLHLRLHTTGGNLSAQALGDIYIGQYRGDLHVGSIVSLQGDVAIVVKDGSILSGTNVDVDELESLDDLHQQWQALGLTGEAAEADLETAIAAQEALVGRQYRRYWQLKDVLKTGADGSLQVTNDGLALYSGIAAANGMDVPEYILGKDGESGEFQRVQNALEDALGTTDLASRDGFSEFDNAWQYTMPEEKRNAFSKGAVWKVSQLENAINAAAVSGAVDQRWLDDPVNIRGHNVTLTSFGDVGSVEKHSFRLDGDGTITNQQRLWLLTAAPAGLEVEQVQGDPNALDVTVSSLSRLRVAADGELYIQTYNAKIDHNLAVGADGSLHVEHVDGNGQVYLAAENDLVGTRPVGAVIKAAAGGLSLKAVHGSIYGPGGESTPLPISINGALISAIAGGSVNLKDVGGTAGLDVGNLYAQDEMRLTTQGDLRQLQGRGYTIGAGSLHLNIGGNGGTVADGSSDFAGPLNLAMHGTELGADQPFNGDVEGHVDGDLYLASDTQGIRLGKEYLAVDGEFVLQSLGDIYVDGFASILYLDNDNANGDNATLQTTGSMIFDPWQFVSGDLNLIANDLRMEAGSKVRAERFNIGVTGDAVLSQLVAWGEGSGSGSAVTVNAGGSILSSMEPGVPNIIVQGPQDVRLDAGGDIGSSTTPLALDIDGTWVSASAGGAMYLTSADGAAGLGVGNLYAQDEMLLVSRGDLRQLQGHGYTIGAGSLELQISNGSAGSVADGSSDFAGPLHLAMHGIELGPDQPFNGTLSGSVAADPLADGDLFLASATGDEVRLGDRSRWLNVTGQLMLNAGGDVYVDGPLSFGGGTLQTTGSLLFDNAYVSSAGDLNFIANDFRMENVADIYAEGRINVSATGDAVLGGMLKSNFSGDGESTDPAVTVTAGGDILSSATSTGYPNIVVYGLQGVRLDAGGNIGSLAMPLLVEASSPDVVFWEAAGDDYVTILPQGLDLPLQSD